MSYNDYLDNTDKQQLYESACKLQEEGKFKDALENFLLSVSTFTSMQNAVSFNRIADIYFELEQYFNAIKFYNQAMTMYFRLGERSAKVARCYYKVADCCSFLHKDQEAIINYSRAGEFYTLLRDENMVAMCYYNIACIYNALDKPNQAVTNFEDAVNIFGKIGNVNGLATATYRLATAYDMQHNTGSAKLSYLKAKELYKSLGDNGGVARCEKHLQTQMLY